MSTCKIFSFDEFRKKWTSPVVARTKLEEFSGGLLTGKYVANLDSMGKGPPRIRVGRKVGYPVDSLIQWLEGRAKSCE